MDDHELLNRGEIEIRGRIMPASNATFFGSVALGEHSVECVYKPVAGERPLWDFPDGTLARREVAAYVVSEALGWHVVPPTVLRADAPAGMGMVQAWREPDPGQDPVDLVPEGQVPDGYLHVLDAFDGSERPISLVHEDSHALRRMAVFDVIVNNADRKGGHVLPMRDGHRYGVDHGVCFHTEDKLRTVLWGWAGQRLTVQEAAGVECVVDGLHGDLRDRLADLLTVREVDAIARRSERLLRVGRFPLPAGGWPSIPWPPF